MNKIDELNRRLDELRENEKKIQKYQGVKHSLDQTEREKYALETELNRTKQKIKELESKRLFSIEKTQKTLEHRMGEVLPIGEPVIDFSEDGSLVMGVRIDGVTVGYSALSGGQMVMFESAIQNAFGCSSLVVEAAEIDDGNLEKVLESLSKNDTQVIVNTCHGVPKCPSVWEVINL